MNSTKISQRDFKDIKYGGFLTVSQSGKGEALLKSLSHAFKNNLTCFNIINIEDSPLTQAMDNLIKQEEEEIAQKKKDSPTVLYDISDDEDSSEYVQANKNIGLYQKTGHCYSDIKSFIPQIVSIILVGLWFSDNKQ